MIKSSNVGSTDRVLRIVIGLVLIALPFLTAWPMWSSGALMWASVLVGVVLIGTALLRFCPIYGLIGVRTCKTN